MDFFKINKKCTGCGICVEICPIRIIKKPDGDKIPTMVEGGEERCIRCGHCLSVCPEGAISFSEMAVEDCKVLPENWRIHFEKIETFFKARRSIRVYQNKPVEKEKLVKLIETVKYAPSGINRQPVCWAVIHDTEKVKEISRLVIEWMRGMVNANHAMAGSLNMEKMVKSYDKGNDPISRGAPHLVISYALKDDLTAPQACTIALSYMELAAMSLGLGTCWAGYVHMGLNYNPEIKKFIGLSHRTDCFGAMMIGYPKYEYKRIPMRNKPHVRWISR